MSTHRRQPHPILLPLLASLAFAPPSLAELATPTEDVPLETLFRTRTQELMDAVAPGNQEPWQRYLHAEMLSVDENGSVADKATLLAELTPLPPGLVGSIVVDRFRLTRVGDVAVVAVEIQESLDYHGQQLHTRFRFLDTWVEVDGDWLLLGRHTAAELKDPPAVALSAAELGEYAGRYRLTDEITTEIRVDPSGRELISERTGRPAVVYKAELRDLFFAPGQPRARRLFERDAAGRVIAFADRREGEDIRWTREGAETSTH